MGHHPNQSELENILYHLNYRRGATALAEWMGGTPPFRPYELYDGFDRFLSLDTWAALRSLPQPLARSRLSHAFVDHYLQKILLPHETEMRTWMRGAAAHVDGRKIYFRDIVPWCQRSSTFEQRRALQKETGPLCKFLRPFAVNYWNIVLEVLRQDFGFDGYVAYCRDKKGVDYPAYYEVVQELLRDTEDLYRGAMERWCRNRFGRPLSDCTRFDAIHLLGLGEFDGMFRVKRLRDLLGFVHHWGIDMEHTPGLTLEMGSEEQKSAQAMSFILEVPEEVYILMKPAGGWIDLETLWHELGHGFSAVFTSPDLSTVERDMATSYSLSEAYAFFLQNMVLSPPFLETCLGMSPSETSTLRYHKVLKDFSIFRRYAGKFLVEFEMFSNGFPESGDRYSELMTRHTGFYYQPESHLFDLVPEFYSLDYVLGWMGEAMFTRHFQTLLGDRWMFDAEAGRILKGWWRLGNMDMGPFMQDNGLGSVGPQALVKRWEETLGGS